MTVALIGQVSRDVVEGEARLGGPVLYASRALQALGARFTAAAKATESEPLGGSIARVPAASVPEFTFSYDGDVRTMEVTALGEPWSAADVEAAGVDAEWVQLGAVLRGDFPADALAAIAGRRLALDAHGLVRLRRLGPLTLDGDADPALLAPLTVLKLAEEEAVALAGGADAASVAALGVPEVLVTFGSRGALVAAGGRSERVAAGPTAADPTGAGDAFLAGYVASRAAGAEPVEAARAASHLVAELLTS
jgi:sugar/nucleoside kinase (ribokinase family)